MANIYLNKETKRFYIKNYVNGINHTITRDNNGAYFETEEEAQNFINNNVNCLKYQKNLSRNKCSYFFNIYLANMSRNFKASHFMSEKYICTSIIFPYFRNVSLSRLDNTVLMNFSNEINDKLISYRYKERIFTRTKSFLDSLIPYIPIQLDLRLLTINKNTPKDYNVMEYYSFEDFKTFFNNLNNDFYKFMFLMLFNYGLRIGELRAIKVSDFDLINNSLYITKALNSKNESHKTIITSPKTNNSVRTYPLNKDLIALYNSMIKFKNKNAFVFTFAKKEKNADDPDYVISENTIRKKNEDNAKKSNLQKIRIHDYRHSCAIYLITHGFDLTRVANWIGDNPETVAHYYLKYKDRSKNEISDAFQLNVNERLKE